MKAIQKFRGLILVAMVLSGSQAFAQTTPTDQKQQPVSSDQVLTRTPKSTNKTSELPATSGCTELTRVKPAIKRTTTNVPKQDAPVTIDRIKRD